MPMRFEDHYRCVSVDENNGIIKSRWVPGRDGTEFSEHSILIERPRESGVPRIGEVNFTSSRPAFPHES